MLNLVSCIFNSIWLGNVLSVYCDGSFSVKFAKSDLVVCYDIDGRSEYDINRTLRSFRT